MKEWLRSKRLDRRGMYYSLNQKQTTAEYEQFKVRLARLINKR